MEKVTGAGHKAILSACWYLNYINYGMDWPMVWYCYYLMPHCLIPVTTVPLGHLRSLILEPRAPWAHIEALLEGV